MLAVSYLMPTSRSATTSSLLDKLAGKCISDVNPNLFRNRDKLLYSSDINGAGQMVIDDRKFMCEFFSDCHLMSAIF